MRNNEGFKIGIVRRSRGANYLHNYFNIFYMIERVKKHSENQKQADRVKQTAHHNRLSSTDEMLAVLSKVQKHKQEKRKK